ncbi:MAG: response regulator [Nitrosospira multiformis]|nr:response regulator [Nitrosospira multiformis]
MRLLLIEDDDDLRDTLIQALSFAGYGIDPVSNASEAITALSVGAYDLVVLDLELPDLDGMELLRMMRGRRDSTPVLILTARDGVDQRILGLKSGADDYLVKPFSLPELEARIQALIRRSSGGMVHLMNGPLKLDPATKQVFMNGNRIDFSIREITLLEALMKRAGEVVIKARLTQQISEWNREIGANNIEVYIHRLRKKLEPHGISIRTIHGLGYLMERHDAV